MPLHVPNKVELISKLDNLKIQTKKTYINVGKKVLLTTIHIMNKLAHNLVSLQDSELSVYSVFGPNEQKKLPNQKRPHIHGSRVGGTHYPFLIVRQQFKDMGLPVSKLSKNETVDLSRESDYIASALQVARAAESTKDVENYEATRALDLIKSSLGVSPPQTDPLEEVNIVSGSRSVSKKKISAKKVAPKKATPKKKAVTVRRVKKGVFRRVED